MIHEILLAVDKNSEKEKIAVFCAMVDWKQPFDRQCPKLDMARYKARMLKKSFFTEQLKE